MLEIGLYIAGYLVALSLFVAFGRFLKECDQNMSEQFKEKQDEQHKD